MAVYALLHIPVSKNVRVMNAKDGAHAKQKFERDLQMGPYFCSSAPYGFRKEIDRLEAHVDNCYKRLKLLNEPQNLATWAVLTAVIEEIERRYQIPYGLPLFRAAMMNFGRTGALLVDWIQKYGTRRFSPRSKFIWNSRIALVSRDALSIANAYRRFLDLFQFWHKDRSSAEIVGLDRVRLLSCHGPNERRVSAFHKGLYAAKSSFNPAPSKMQINYSPELEAAHVAMLEESVREAPLGFRYAPPTNLYKSLVPAFMEGLNLLFRRDINCDLGTYALRDFESCFGVLLAISSVHIQLCRLRSKGGQFPVSSAVLVMDRQSLIKQITELGGLSSGMTEAILKDLTIPTGKRHDLHVYPLIPLQSDDRLLGIVPHFILDSRPDENILRICSYANCRAFNSISSSKEQEMRDDLSLAIPSCFKTAGPVNLPSRCPDVDFIVEDTRSSTVLIAELKWIRKPISNLERIDRDKDFLKGISQLHDVQRFLQSNPRFLLDGGYLSAALDSYSEVRYLLIARDHFVWVDPDTDFPVIEHEVFKSLVRKYGDLRSMIAEMLSFKWLPIEGTDFAVRIEPIELNDVVVESEIFYAPGSDFVCCLLTSIANL
jgi:hypothetical protein